jgi:DNA repair protein RadC
MGQQPDFEQIALKFEDLSFSGEQFRQSDASHPSVADLADAKHYSLRVPNLPAAECPRARLLSAGPGALSTAELLALLIGSGHSTVGMSAVTLAEHLLFEVSRGDADTLARLRHITVQELMIVPGIGVAKAAAIVAAVELGKRVFHPRPSDMTVVDDPAIAAGALAQDLMWQTQERFAVLFLDVKHRIIATKVITIGSATETLAHPREIFGEAVRRRATRIIVAHNHPSGSLEPSGEDILLTRQLLQGGQTLGIPVLDHLILGNGNYVSLRQTMLYFHNFGRVFSPTSAPQSHQTSAGELHQLRQV